MSPVDPVLRAVAYAMLPDLFIADAAYRLRLLAMRAEYCPRLVGCHCEKNANFPAPYPGPTNFLVRKPSP